MDKQEETAAIFRKCLLGKNMEERAVKEFLSSSQVKIADYPKVADVFHGGNQHK